MRQVQVACHLSVITIVNSPSAGCVADVSIYIPAPRCRTPSMTTILGALRENEHEHEREYEHEHEHEPSHQSHLSSVLTRQHQLAPPVQMPAVSHTDGPTGVGSWRCSSLPCVSCIPKPQSTDGEGPTTEDPAPLRAIRWRIHVRMPVPHPAGS